MWFLDVSIIVLLCLLIAILVMIAIMLYEHGKKIRANEKEIRFLKNEIKSQISEMDVAIRTALRKIEGARRENQRRIDQLEREAKEAKKANEDQHG